MNKNIWSKINIENEDIKRKTDIKEIKDTYKDKKILLTAKNLEMTYENKLSKKKNNIFKDINFEIFENDIIVLLGSNGSGKTTLIEIISGIKKPTNGLVVFHFNNHNKLSVQFQDLSFPNCLNVKDMIDFEISISHSSIDAEELDVMLNMFRLKKLLKTNIKKLSGGQQQRLNVLIALMNKPKIIILDEFTTGLDIAVKNEIKNFILDFCSKHKITIILISHDLDIIDQMANRFLLISDKKLIVDAKRETIIKKFKTIFNFAHLYIC